MAVYFTSDTHYGHHNIIEYCKRPFADVCEMNTTMLNRWNEVVQPEDEVYFLGDFVMNLKYLWYGRHLNGTKHLILGNHDKPFPDKTKHNETYLQAGFASINKELLLPIGEHIVLLNHFPYTNKDPRFPEHKPEDTGRWLLCGHVHDRWRTLERQINVGVDVWDFKPVSTEQILEIINGNS